MLPKPYAWLAREPGPPMLAEALKLYGTAEAPGAADNRTILAWAREVGGRVAAVYSADSIPWCGLFAAVLARRAGLAPPENALWALSWSAFGKPVTAARLGDVLVFTRKGGGHVGLYVGEDQAAYHVLGGNQSDRVSIARIARKRIYAIRRPPYAKPPANLRIVRLAPGGALSASEA